ncbi:hypothetical protein [Jiangella asiatica]|uniref:Uncharacterized protein n=1 Tax=Jiangella asiatica TaxID=2530372 RepID=A0A4V2Z2J6_9ACTN|nr:hypothetical protein [Jiangella asiatica]TDE09098.1 hypothetical protein E1269_15395 [Jiangella asiatica]
MSTTGKETPEQRWAPAYRAHCPTCRESGREFSSYGNAEEAARGHAGKHTHTTYVVDQYGIRIIGSFQRPGELQV